MAEVVELDQMKTEILTYETPLSEVRDSLDLVSKSKRIEELEMEMEAPGFWDDPDKSNAKMKELKNLKSTVDECSGLFQQYEDILTLIEMGYEEDDAAMAAEIRQELRLVQYALPDVYKMGGAEGLFGGGTGLPGRG